MKILNLFSLYPALLACVLSGLSVEQSPRPDTVHAARAHTDAAPYVRTELFFGTAKPGGYVVSEEEFLDFVAREITPRFPNGLTMIDADGQFKGRDGAVIREKAFLIVLLHPFDDRRLAGDRIEEVRRLYSRQFKQQCVMRVDDAKVWVSF